MMVEVSIAKASHMVASCWFMDQKGLFWCVPSCTYPYSSGMIFQKMVQKKGVPTSARSVNPLRGASCLHPAAMAAFHKNLIQNLKLKGRP